jgi:hypothetical protein
MREGGTLDTVSWRVRHLRAKCSLFGHSEQSAGADASFVGFRVRRGGADEEIYIGESPALVAG